MTFKESIISEFNSGEFKRISAKSLARRFNFIKTSDKAILNQALTDLEKEGVLICIDGFYSLFNEKDYIKGKIRTFERGFAFLIPEDGSADMFIPPKSRNGAFQGDEVLAKKTYENDIQSDEAEVIKVLRRGTERLSGTFHTHGRYCYVMPDDKNFGCRVVIRKDKTLSAIDGEQVVCKLTRYPIDDDPQGEIIEVCGNPNDVASREQAILATSGIVTEFSSAVLAEAERIPMSVCEKSIANRTDFRNMMTVTIDGDYAKDFDDAISVIEKDDGFTLYVHIADVSEYVKTGGKIDKEAYVRGTSVYLPDRVIPMLPERLCNGICSLNPGEDRLTLSVRLEYDLSGNLLEKSFYKSIIKSFKRLTYKKVQGVLDGDEAAIEEYSEVIPLIKSAKKLKDLMLKNRREAGCVDLDIAECEVRSDGEDVIVEKREGLESERIIEQFMIAANVAVAEFAFYAELPLIYRVHEKPSAEKIQSFTEFLAAVGVDGKKYKFKYPKDYQCVLDKLIDRPLYPVVNNVMLRSMQKAVYLSENRGHFGLNEKCYCHFTSPIRRYPDLIVHRIIKGVLEGRTGEVVDEYYPKIEQLAANCTDCERKSDIVSRDIDDLYICKFMRKFIGDYFQAVVSGVTSNGLYLRLENSVEGFLPVERLPRGNYEFFDKGYTLAAGKKKFTLGDELIVKLISSDVSSSRIYFDYIGRADKLK